MHKDQETLAKVELAKVRDEWLRRPGVTAIDIGLRRKDGRLTDEVVVRVHIENADMLETLAEAREFPERLGGVPVDLILGSYGLE